MFVLIKKKLFMKLCIQYGIVFLFLTILLASTKPKYVMCKKPDDDEYTLPKCNILRCLCIAGLATMSIYIFTNVMEEQKVY